MTGPDRLRVGDKSAEEENHALALAFKACWNTHDMQAFGRMLTVDADWVAVGGSHWKGCEEIEREHAARHATQFKESGAQQGRSERTSKRTPAPQGPPARSAPCRACETSELSSFALQQSNPVRERRLSLNSLPLPTLI